MENLERLGVRFDLVAAQLENEGVQKFVDPYPGHPTSCMSCAAGSLGQDLARILCNRTGFMQRCPQDRRRMHDTGVLARRFAGFGWRTAEIDGHDMAAIVGPLEAAHDGGLTAILARTVKGKGVCFLEGADGWHGRALDRQQMARALDSTGLDAFATRYPERFFESFIAEQNMIGVSLGLAASGKISYAATFACFLTRADDFIRMAQYSRPAHLVLCGSHAGVSIGEDGPSQMGLEDLAMFRALIDSTCTRPMP